MKLNPYLTFSGQCETAFKFYEKALGGKIEAMMTAEGTARRARMAQEDHARAVKRRRYHPDG